MHIIEINVSDPVASGNGRTSALVVFISVNQQVILTAHADENAVRETYVDDALRQLRRLPEFRRSAGDLTFAEGLLNAPESRCA